MVECPSGLFVSMPGSDGYCMTFGCLVVARHFIENDNDDNDSWLFLKETFRSNLGASPTLEKCRDFLHNPASGYLYDAGIRLLTLRELQVYVRDTPTPHAQMVYLTNSNDEGHVVVFYPHHQRYTPIHRVTHYDLDPIEEEKELANVMMPSDKEVARQVFEHLRDRANVLDSEFLHAAQKLANIVGDNCKPEQWVTFHNSPKTAMDQWIQDYKASIKHVDIAMRLVIGYKPIHAERPAGREAQAYCGRKRQGEL